LAFFELHYAWFYTELNYESSGSQSQMLARLRLANSLPRELPDDRLRASSPLKLRTTSRDAFLAANPPPWDDLTKACYHGPFSDKLDQRLDAAHGSCALRDPRLAQIVEITFAMKERQED
jgi:hypothetical protein